MIDRYDEVSMLTDLNPRGYIIDAAEEVLKEFK